MDDRHDAHRYLTEPSWARGKRPTSRRVSDLDLSDLSGSVIAADVVRRAARNVSPLTLTSPAIWMLREALAKVHGVDAEQILARVRLEDLMASITRAFLGPGDRVALAEPCRPELLRPVLVAGARYVDIGRDQSFCLQQEALERIAEDGELNAVILGRPAVPASTTAR